MRQSASSRRITASIFDRLTDREPRSATDIPLTNWDEMRELKLAVARDLTDLLNTRRSESDIAEEFEQTNRSIAAFGVRDFGSSPVEAEVVRRAIEKCIRTFEPRLSHVTVIPGEISSFRLGFRVAATLHVDLHSEAVMFDAAMPVDSKRFRVSESR